MAKKFGQKPKSRSRREQTAPPGPALLGTIVSVTTTKWVQNGFCLAHTEDGVALFVHGALPEETVRVLIDRERTGHRFGRVIEVTVPSAERLASDCSAFPTCGGCSFRHMTYAQEVLLKKQLLLEFSSLRALHEQGRLEFVQSPPDGYRMTVRLHHGKDSFGFYAPHSRSVVEFPESGCAQLLPELNEKILGERGRANSNGTALDQSGAVSGATVGTRGGHSESRAVSVVDRSYLAHTGGVAVQADFASKSIVGVQVGALRWEFPLGVFFQNNRPLLQPWLEWMQARVPEGQPDTAELFCGTGIVSGYLRPRLGEVRGYDSDPGGLAAARQNFKRLQFEGQFSNVDLYSRTPQLPNSALMICNPPRAGLNKALVAAIGKLSRLSTILYSSCNQATLDRDLKALQVEGFVAKEAAVFDFFPRTPHTETVVLLHKESGA